MKPLILLLICLSICTASFGQFVEKTSLQLPDSITTTRAEWVDLDNDGLLDVLLLARSTTNHSFLMFLKGDTVNTPVLHPNSTPIDPFQEYYLTDINRDNAIDVLLSGTTSTAAYINRGNFIFEESKVDVFPFTLSRFDDLNNDARSEWLMGASPYGVPHLYTFKENTSGQWNLFDSLQIDLRAMEVLDINYDGYHDVVVSGRLISGTLYTGFLINRGGGLLDQQPGKEWLGKVSTADLDADGIMDVVFSGVDKNGNGINKLYQNGSWVDFENSLKETDVFAADLNSDGLVDRSLFGKGSVDPLHSIQYTTGVESIPASNVIHHNFGDLDHDGDLDLVQVVDDGHRTIRIVENTEPEKNQRPSRPARAIAVRVFDRLFIYWEKSTDDHTAIPSLTYDLYLGDVQVGGFDLLNEMRLITRHGNNGTQNFRLLKDLPENISNYAIQSIDNSLHAGKGGVCMGGGAVACVNVETTAISVCSKEAVDLSSPEESLWFSFADGFLGSAASLTVQPEADDTVFSFTPTKIGCDALKLWTIAINNDTIKKEVEIKYACAGSTLTFDVEPGWQDVHWSCQLHGSLGTASPITHVLQQPDSIFVTLTNAEGCTIRRATALLISKPDVTVDADRYKILKGSEVQLNAHGAARYQWAPASGLSKTDIPNPIATPTATIQYTVTGYDSLDCTDQATVTIEVEGTGFIPTLFTPNDDGTNDELKIYGLNAANDFTFSIVNREGSLVYKTTNVNDVVQHGWDGSVNGVKQPSGVYFWKVKGVMTSGDKLLLNGKTSGSIVLVR